MSDVKLQSSLASQIQPAQGLRERLPASGTGATTGPTEFRKTLENLTSAATALSSPSAPSSLKFSGHAVERMRTRGITYSPEQVTQIQGAIDKVAQKGGRNALLLMDSSALIVNTDSRTVVTVMDKANLKENVFTNIDSTMVI